MRYCGREFTPAELEYIRQLIATNPTATRAALSRYVCEYLLWYRPDGRLKDMSCRVAMLRMHEDGLLELPLPRKTNNNGQPYTRRTGKAEPPDKPVTISASAFAHLRIHQIVNKDQSYLWNEYIQRYHYLGYRPVPGDQIRYMVSYQEQVVALLGFRAAVWKTAPRDHFIGWTTKQRKQNLHLIANNARFLILPWVDSYNLASKVLSMATRRLADDWLDWYQYAPVLVETFVERDRFVGTSYRAANWIYLGQTKGMGRLGAKDKPTLPIKSIWVYPLHKCFRNKLCS